MKAMAFCLLVLAVRPAVAAQNERPPDQRPANERPPDERPPNERPPDERPPPSRLEIQGGLQAPLGFGGAALAFPLGCRFALAFGAGIGPRPDEGSMVHFAAAARLRIFTVGRISVGTAVAVSHHQWDAYPGSVEGVRWHWEHSLWPSLAAAAEWRRPPYTVRLEAGVARATVQPSCSYKQAEELGWQGCATVHTEEPSPLFPFVSLSLAADLGRR
jgi:hypothetical protein